MQGCPLFLDEKSPVRLVTKDRCIMHRTCNRVCCYIVCLSVFDPCSRAQRRTMAAKGGLHIRLCVSTLLAKSACELGGRVEADELTDRIISTNTIVYID